MMTHQLRLQQPSFVPSPHWSPGDLDLYVPDHCFDNFVAALTDPSGLNFTLSNDTPSRRKPTSPLSGRLVKQLNRYTTPTRLHVDVIRSPQHSPVTPLQGFWSTLVMNFLTPHGIACAFPDATMTGQAFVKSGPLSSRDHLAISKYIDRGFTIARDVWWSDEPDFDPGLLRYFGDQRTLVIDFRANVEDRQPSFPIVPTRKGWFITRPFPRKFP